MFTPTLNQVAWFVTLSNLVGVLPLYQAVGKLAAGMAYDAYIPITWWIELILLFLSIVASILMHMSETKHGLNGVLINGKPFTNYSMEFLWMDRFAALFLGGYVAIEIWRGTYHLTRAILVVGVVGLVAMFVSENIARTPVQFAMTHSLWHAIAYMTLWTLFAEPLF